MTWRLLTCALLLLSALVAGCAAPGAAQPATITVSAASDLQPAFEELGRRFTAETGVQVKFNFGSTGQLAQQIERGAPVDLFAAANAAFVDDLAQLDLIIPDTRALYARGRITLWTRADSPIQLDQIEDLMQPAVRRVAIANPEHAPYGVAAREALQRAGIWEQIQPKLVFGENVSQTLQLADTGNVDAAIVALSLSIASDGRWTLIPETLHAPLDQVLVVIRGTQHEAAARSFAAFVNGPEGRPIMRRYGFVLPGEGAP